LRKLATWPGLTQRDHLRQIINALDVSLVERKLMPLEVLRLNSDAEMSHLLTPAWHFGESALDMACAAFYITAAILT